MGKKKLALSWQILIGFVLGIVLGLIFKGEVMRIKIVGDIFMKLLKMLVMPLVVFSLIDGISSIEDTQKLRKVSFKTFAFFIINTIIACFFGIFLMKIFNPGKGVTIDLASAGNYEPTKLPTVSETLISMFPENVFDSLAKGSMIQVIVFALFFSVAIASLGKKVPHVKAFMSESATIMYKVTGYVIALSPIGVCSLIACSVGEYGLGIFGALGRFIIADYAAQLLFCGLVYLPLCKFVAKVDLGYFMKKILRVWVMTASTTSSAGSLPVSMDVTTNDFGVDSEISSFVLPLGATLNMAGGALYDAAIVVFAAQVYGIELTFMQLFLLVATATLICIGAPGIPGGGVVAAVMLMSLLNLPVTIAGMIAGVYRLLDIAHTTMNVTGDVVAALCVARTENMMSLPEQAGK